MPANERQDLIRRLKVNAQNCTSGVFGRKLLLIHVILKYKLLCVWLCRRNMFQVFCCEHTERLDCVWICSKVIKKWVLKKWRLWPAESIRSIYNLKIAVISEDIWQKKMNILTIYPVPTDRFAHTPCSTACLCSVLQTAHHTAVPKSV